MRSMIARLIGLRRRRRTPGAAAARCETPTSTGTTSSRFVERRKRPAHGSGPHPAARRLAEAIEIAIARGQWERAERLARDAARIMHTSARLTERIARLRLAQGRAEAALSIVEASRMDSASMRLLRAACLIELGRAAEAHLDLRDWSRKSTAPMEARRLLALLECGSTSAPVMSGDREAAVQALLQNLRQIEDPQTIQLLLLDAVTEGRDEQAHHWAQRLLLATRWNDDENANAIEPAMLLETLGLDAAKIDRETPAATPAQIEALAMELIATPGIEQIMPAMIRAQEESPDVRAVQLMYEAARRAVDSVSNPAAMCESLAHLAMLLERRHEAAHWAMRGAEINPMSASLARLVHELSIPPDGPSEARVDAAEEGARRMAA